MAAILCAGCFQKQEAEPERLGRSDSFPVRLVEALLVRNRQYAIVIHASVCYALFLAPGGLVHGRRYSQVSTLYTEPA